MNKVYVQKFTKGNKILKIVQDEQPINPREWDNLGKMVCFHRRYDLGDKHDLKIGEFESWEAMKAHLFKEGAVVIYPLFLYDHSGLWLKIGDFSKEPLPQGHARFDSGQVGFIYATKEDIRKNFGIKKVGKEQIERTKKVLKTEVETYAQYLAGDIYGFEYYEIKKCDSCGAEHHENVDSCFGFYGTNWKENGLLEQVGIESLEGWEEVENEKVQHHWKK